MTTPKDWIRLGYSEAALERSGIVRQTPGHEVDWSGLLGSISADLESAARDEAADNREYDDMPPRNRAARALFEMPGEESRIIALLVKGWDAYRNELLGE